VPIFLTPFYLSLSPEGMFCPYTLLGVSKLSKVMEFFFYNRAQTLDIDEQAVVNESYEDKCIRARIIFLELSEIQIHIRER
jgi:hypothetical protein